MQWLIAIAVFVLLMLFMPSAVRFATKSARGKRGLGGATLALGIAFAFIFDPPKAAAIENIQKKMKMVPKREMKATVMSTFRRFRGIGGDGASSLR